MLLNSESYFNYKLWEDSSDAIPAGKGEYHIITAKWGESSGFLLSLPPNPRN